MRVQDLDFDRGELFRANEVGRRPRDLTRDRELTVRNGKGWKDRRALLPQSLVVGLKQHLSEVRRLHASDLKAGWGAVSLPYALAKKYANAKRQWGWQWVFPQSGRWRDPETGREGRHHLDPSEVQTAVKRPYSKLVLPKRQAAIPFAIPLRPTCWKEDKIFERFRN